MVRSIHGKADDDLFSSIVFQSVCMTECVCECVCV